MDDQNISNQNQQESHDSDIESRLYAELYYSNTIIGDEINPSISNPNNEILDNKESSSTNDYSTLNDSLINSDYDINNATCSYVQRNLRNEVETTYSAINKKQHILNVEIQATSKSKHSSPTQDTNNSKQLNAISSDKSRLVVHCMNNSELHQINKKRKNYSNMDSAYNTETQKNTSNVLDIGLNNPTTSDKNSEQIILQNSENRIINPYSKQVTNNSITRPGLLSAEFINLLFGKSVKKKNYAKRRKLQKLKKKSHLSNVTPRSKENEFRSHTVQNDGENKNNEEENTLYSLSNDSEIIDISSESSIEDNSKYKTIATDKKLHNKESEFIDVDLETSISDSEESIFEVPVPPKPAPPLIELKDSDKESSYDSESSSLSSDAQLQDLNQKILNTLSNDTVAEKNIEIEESESLILNCTEVQKSAASLNEIKKMSQKSFSTKESTKNVSVCDVNMYNMKNVQNLQCQSSKSTVHKKNMFNEKINNNSSLEGNKTNNEQNVPLKEHFFPPMNNRMKSFYNDSWGGENFDLDKLKSQMSTDPNKWAILDDDLVISYSKKKRYFGMICNRCQKDGHRQNNCPEPFKYPVCHMCGEHGHLEINCPKKICLTCGKKQNMYRKTCENCQKLNCSRCNSRGHLSFSCPDLWRRYHHTIKNINIGGLQMLKANLKPTSELFCCNCANKGHDSFNCRKFRWSQHFPNPSQIINYNGPTYNNENFDSSSYVDDIQENSFNSYTTYDQTNFTGNNSDPINLNELNQRTHGTRYTNSNLVENTHNYLYDNSKASSSKIIFRIISKKINIDTERLDNFVLKLNVSEHNGSSNFENWKSLWSFLNALVSEIPFHFLLTQKHTDIRMNIRCPKKFTNVVSQLINLYAGRTNYERSLMYLNPERNKTTIFQNLTTKFDEVRRLHEDPLQLHEKIVTLTRELSEQEQAMNDLQILSKVKQITYCKQKLLMALYKEGCVDDSLHELRKICKRLKEHIDRTGKKPKKTTPLPFTLLSFKDLFQYIYHYNNVFVAYELKNLFSCLDKYRNYMQIRINLKDNPLLLQQNVTELSSTSHETSSILPSNTVDVSKIPSLLSLNTIMSGSQTACNIINTNSLNDDQYIPLEKRKKFNNLKNQPNKLYMRSISVKKLKHRKQFANQFKQFISTTKNLLHQARILNAPTLEKNINILQNKMKNEIYVHKRDVTPLKKLVAKELKKREDNQQLEKRITVK